MIVLLPLLLCGAAQSHANPIANTKFGAQPALAKELIARTKKDQDVRNRVMGIKDQAAQMKEMIAMQAIDKNDTVWMRTVIRRYGWPTKRLVGQEASGDAWLLVQHADQDRPFQRECLKLMLPYMDAAEVKRPDVALLIDRVLVGEGKDQLYGSQWKFENGDIAPSTPISDPAKVDQRRHAMNLLPLEDYKTLLRKVYANMIATSAKKL